MEAGVQQSADRLGTGIRVFASLVFSLCIVEFVASFRGEMAFVRRYSLILAPLYAPRLESAEIADFRSKLEARLAGHRSYKIFPGKLIENYYLEKGNRVGVFNGSWRGKNEAIELGRSLEMERVAIGSVLSYANKMVLNIVIRDVRTEQVVTRFLEEAENFESLEINFDDEIAVPGFTIAAWLYVIWLVFLALWAVILGVLKFQWRLWTEFLMGWGVLLGIFSWIYALNGDMDYVQRFAATSGLLDIGDTSSERLATLIRYGPPIFMLMLYSLFLFFLNIGWFGRGDLREGLQGESWNVRPPGLEGIAPLLTTVSALLYSFSLPNSVSLTGWPLLAWLSISPLYVMIRNCSFLRGVMNVIFFMGLRTLLINWWQGTFSYVSLPFTVSLEILIHFPFALILVFFINRFRRLGLYVAPFFWIFWDWFRSLGYLGYPWGYLGVSQYAQIGLIQLAALGGVWMVSFLPHFSSAMLALAIENGGMGPRPWYPRWLSAFGQRSGLRQWGLPLLTVLGTVGVYLGGMVVVDLRDAAKEKEMAEGRGRQLEILLLQPNTDPRKHAYARTFDELVSLTETGRTMYGDFDLVVWPESGFPPDIRYWLNPDRNRTGRARLVSRLLDWQSQGAIPLVTGTQDHFYEKVPGVAEPVKRIQNSSVYLVPEGRGQREYYYKIRLVPFTENFPYGEQFPWIAELLHNFSTTQWTPGEEHHVFQAERFRFSTPICFEDVFPDHARRYVKAGAEVLVNLSNDYWANTPLEGFQHGAHAVFRAVENRRPLVRSTTSGLTISVDTEGRIARGWPEFYTADWFKADVYLPGELSVSLYTRFGDWFPLFCGIFWLGILFWDMVKKREGD